MNKTAIILLIGVLAAALGWFFLGDSMPGSAEGPGAGRPGPGPGGRFGGQPIPVSVAEAQLATLSETIEAIGTTRANESVTITAKVTDKITRVNFSDGQYVNEGDLLVELTNAEQTAQLAEARADLNDAATQLERLEGLAAKGTASKAQVDESRARHAIAEARLEAIMARLDDRVIRAPFSGVLGLRQISPGTLVSPGSEITTLDDLSTLKLDFAVPELFLSAVEVGSPVVAKSASYGDDTFEGSVSGVDPRIDDITRSVTVRAAMPNEDGRLRPGMLMTVALITNEHTALSVPDTAVIAGQDQSYVYVVDNESTAYRRSVQTGISSGGRIEIKSGLEMGERVVVLGLLRLRDGAPVVVRNASARLRANLDASTAAG